MAAHTQIILMRACLCFKSGAVCSILLLLCEKPGSLSTHQQKHIKAFHTRKGISLQLRHVKLFSILKSA